MFALVDGNNFYCSCERVFNPTLSGCPIIVLSNNDGCVISRSNEAKAIGVKMGVPVHEIKNFIEQHKISVFSSNYALYGDMSPRVMTVLATFAPEIEVYSIDECFLDFHGFENYNLLSAGLLSGSGPEDLTAMAISFPMRVKFFAILSQRANMELFLTSNILPMALHFLLLD